MSDPSCSACRSAPATGYGRCPVCGKQWEAPAAPPGDPTMKLKLAALVLTFVGAIGWVGWTYRETFAQDPGMIGLVAFCGLLGLAGGVGKLMGWKRNVQQARDLMNP